MGNLIRKIGVHFRVEKEIKDSACVIAIKHKVKLSDIIRTALIEYLKRNKG